MIYTVTHHFQVAVTVTVSEEGHKAAYAASEGAVDEISSTITTAVAENPDLSATVCADESKPFEMEWA